MKQKILISGLLVLTANIAIARDTAFEPAMHEAVWENVNSPTACILRQHVPYYGKAEFAWRAGEALNFVVMPNHSPDQPTTAQFKSLPPMWKSKREALTLTEVELAADASTISLDTTLAHRGLQELAAGMEPAFIYTDWHDGKDMVLLKLSPVTFLPAYEKYNACIKALLDYGYDDIANSIVNFDSDAAVLNEASRTQLKRIAAYALGDVRVKTIFVDGHTDDTHSDAYNVKLSNRRAKAVKEFLTRAGIPAKQIEMKAHSEWVPVASNLSSVGRSVNRRVEVTLVRE